MKQIVEAFKGFFFKTIIQQTEALTIDFLLSLSSSVVFSWVDC